MITTSSFNDQIITLQDNFQISLTPLQIARLGQHFLNQSDPGPITLEFTEQQWVQRVTAHPVETWVAEGTREFEVELIDEQLWARIRGALGMNDELPREHATTLGDYIHRWHDLHERL